MTPSALERAAVARRRDLDGELGLPERPVGEPLDADRVADAEGGEDGVRAVADGGPRRDRDALEELDGRLLVDLLPVDGVAVGLAALDRAAHGAVLRPGEEQDVALLHADALGGAAGVDVAHERAARVDLAVALRAEPRERLLLAGDLPGDGLQVGAEPGDADAVLALARDDLRVERQPPGGEVGEERAVEAVRVRMPAAAAAAALGRPLQDAAVRVEEVVLRYGEDAIVAADVEGVEPDVRRADADRVAALLDVRREGGLEEVLLDGPRRGLERLDARRDAALEGRDDDLVVLERALEPERDLRAVGERRLDLVEACDLARAGARRDHHAAAGEHGAHEVLLVAAALLVVVLVVVVGAAALALLLRLRVEPEEDREVGAREARLERRGRLLGRVRVGGGPVGRRLEAARADLVAVAEGDGDGLVGGVQKKRVLDAPHEVAAEAEQARAVGGGLGADAGREHAVLARDEEEGRLVRERARRVEREGLHAGQGLVRREQQRAAVGVGGHRARGPRPRGIVGEADLDALHARGAELRVVGEEAVGREREAGRREGAVLGDERVEVAVVDAAAVRAAVGHRAGGRAALLVAPQPPGDLDERRAEPVVELGRALDGGERGGLLRGGLLRGGRGGVLREGEDGDEGEQGCFHGSGPFVSERYSMISFSGSSKKLRVSGTRRPRRSTTTAILVVSARRAIASS